MLQKGQAVKKKSLLKKGEAAITEMAWTFRMRVVGYKKQAKLLKSKNASITVTVDDIVQLHIPLKHFPSRNFSGGAWYRFKRPPPFERTRIECPA